MSLQFLLVVSLQLVSPAQCRQLQDVGAASGGGAMAGVVVAWQQGAYVSRSCLGVAGMLVSPVTH